MSGSQAMYRECATGTVSTVSPGGLSHVSAVTFGKLCPPPCLELIFAQPRPALAGRAGLDPVGQGRLVGGAHRWSKTQRPGDGLQGFW